MNIAKYIVKQAEDRPQWNIKAKPKPKPVEEPGNVSKAVNYIPNKIKEVGDQIVEGADRVVDRIKNESTGGQSLWDVVKGLLGYNGASYLGAGGTYWGQGVLKEYKNLLSKLPKPQDIERYAKRKALRIAPLPGVKNVRGVVENPLTGFTGWKGSFNLTDLERQDLVNRIKGQKRFKNLELLANKYRRGQRLELVGKALSGKPALENVQRKMLAPAAGTLRRPGFRTLLPAAVGTAAYLYQQAKRPKYD